MYVCMCNTYICFYGWGLWISPYFYGWGSTASRLEQFRGGNLLFTTKFPEFPVFILSTSEGWKTESTLEPPSGLEHRSLDWESSTLTTRPMLHIPLLLISYIYIYIYIYIYFISYFYSKNLLIDMMLCINYSVILIEPSSFVMFPLLSCILLAIFKQC